MCWYKGNICNYCGKLGHKAKFCHSAHKQRKSQPLHNAFEHSRIKQQSAQHQLESEPETNSPGKTDNSLTSSLVPAHHVNVEVNGHNLQLELDTGSANTVVSERVWRSFGAINLSTAPQLTAYGGFLIPVLGSAQVTAKFKEKVKHLPLVVVNRDSPLFLERIWIKSFNTIRIWHENAPVNSISSEDVAVKSRCQEYADLFEPGLEKIRGYQAHIYNKPNARFCYFKPRPVSFAMKDKIETDLARLLKLGVIEPVQSTEF